MKKSLAKRFSSPLLFFSLALSALPLACIPGKAQTESAVTVYFPNWNVYSDSEQQVKNLPWDRLDGINHAFWKIVPQNGGYAIVSTDPWADTDESNPQAHFPQYAQYAKMHPQVSILLSIGGWSCSGFFSEMALTKESRASFIQSCLDTLNTYPFFSGLDIDWEYPGFARAGSGSDQGNPVKGDDKTNYTLLLQELRAALDKQFGKGKKQLTVCAAASTSILAKQDYAAIFPYVDRINLMTYDMTGAYDTKTGHHSALYGSVSADTAVKYLQNQGVPASKIAIGSPLYSQGWKMRKTEEKTVGTAAQGLSAGNKTWRSLRSIEKSAAPEGMPGWHLGFDEAAQAAYLWNDDPASPSYRYFYSYENGQSLDAKLRYVRAHSLGGIIVWQSGGDDPSDSWPMLTQMYTALHP